MQNLRILVCERCTDTPQEQLRSIILPADPVPIRYPRVEPFAYDEAGSITGEPYGVPVGLVMAAIPTLFNDVVQGREQALLSLVSNGVVCLATTASPHGMKTDDQIAVAGLEPPVGNPASGFFSVVVITPMLFTWTPLTPIPPQSLLTPTATIVTAEVGLPRGQTTLSQIGP